MLSRQRKDADPGLVDLMAVVGENLGEFLHVFSQARDREQLVAELQQTRRSHEFLLRASRVLADATGYHQTVERLAQVAVPVLADLCLIDVRDEGARVQRVAAWHADPAKAALTEKLRTQYPPDPSGAHPSVEVMRTGRSSWAAEMTDEFLMRTSRDEEHFSVLKQLGFTSYMTVPLQVRGRVLGTVTLVSAGSGRRFSAKDLSAAEELAAQVASVVERARMFDREQRISHELQRALLPAGFPDVPGWSFAASYVPAAEGAEVGGDWFDVIALQEGAVALVVGDVEGHDIEAAKAMASIRHVLSLLVVEEGAPGAALRRLNRYLVSTGAERLTTVLLGVLGPNSGALTLASAGHPPALAVKGPRSRELSVSPGPPLGVADGYFAEHVHLLGDDCLVMFTDGLIERRGAGFDDGLALLRQVVASAPSYQPQQLVDHILGQHLDGPVADDVAVLAVKRQIGGRTE
jgi:serine/threonine-protein kinase RsbW